MGRMNRHQWQQAAASRQRPQQPKKFSRQEINEFIRRHFKRRMIEQGLLPETPEKPPKFVFSYTHDGKPATVPANSRSDARCRIKKLLGVSKLPPGFKLEKVSAN